jgi:hypothetical protein
MAKKDEILMLEQGTCFIEPGEVGSQITWCVQVKEYKVTYKKSPNYGKATSLFYAQIYLSDCERRISWSCDSIEKVDRAIAELKKARAAMVSGLKLHESMKLPNSEEDDE